LVHAWRVWSAGLSAGAEPLWGHTVLWWARMGKLLQFVAGLVVVLDIVGPNRLRSVGKRAGASLRDVRAVLVRLRSSPERTLNGAIRAAAGLFLVCLNALLLVLLVRQPPLVV
jgi:hypothetical protein